MKRQRDDIVALGKLGQIRVGRRARRTALRRKQLDHDLLAAPGECGKRKDCT